MRNKSKNLKNVVAIALSFILMWPMGLNMDMNIYADSGNDVTDILTDLEVIVKQGGQEIDENGIFTTDAIEVDISFGVPVIGDNPEPPAFVNRNDHAIFKIEGFSLVGNESINLVHNGIELGTLEFTSVDEGQSAQIKVIFDGEEQVFNGGFSEVSAQFTATLEYVGNEQGVEDEDYTVTILGKTFTVRVPALAKEFSGVKEGVKNGTQIDWKIKVEATQGEENLDLGGLKLVEDLTNVGPLVGPLIEAFKINASGDSIGDAEPFSEEWVTQDESVYTLEFPEATFAPVYLYFSTEIEDDFITNGTKTITNTANLFDGEDEKLVVSDSVSFDNKWIEKVAGITEYEIENIEGSDKRVAYITWFITVNHMGASLQNARIIDVLDSRLSFVESQWYEKDGENWTTIEDPNNQRPANDTYYYPNSPLANSPLDKNVQLRIKTKVDPDQNVGHKEINISNNATLTWDNFPGDGQGLGSGTITIGIGTNPINKTVGSYDTTYHTIPWTVTVEASDVSEDLRVIDLLVYETSFDYDNVSSIEGVLGNGDGIESMDKNQLDLIHAELVPSVRQKYKVGSFSSEHGLTHTVYALKDSEGKTIADLVVVSENGSTIDLSDENKSFSFETIVTDPTWYLSNQDRSISNTAMLFSANNKVNQRTASRTINPRSIKKDMLKAEAGVDPILNKNDATTDRTQGFNYEDKSVVFRLFVNQNGVDATGGLTTIDGEDLGEITVEDILPAGWEFVEIAENKMFYLFEASGSPNSMMVGDRLTEYSGILGSSVFSEENRKATFTFSELKTPYVIFVKASPIEATLNTYFNDNKTTTVTNTLSLGKTSDSSFSSSTQEVRIISQILDKTMDNIDDGILSWTITYRPYDVFQNTQVLDQYRLIDTLPEGLEVYTDSQGNLDFSEGNFIITEMALTPSGYIASGPVFTEQELSEFISYENETRKLIFNIPDVEKAYKFEYKTMVTANTGSLTNTVVLEGVDLDTIHTFRVYSVASSDASATMTRNGWIEITKTNYSNNSPLSGAVFEIRTESGNAFRSGTTGVDGKVILRGLPVGIYTLVETTPPDGFNLLSTEYNIEVYKDGDAIKTSIDEKTGNDSNKTTITNIQTGTIGGIEIKKNIVGNDASATKEFDFEISITDLPDGDYAYIGSGGKINGNLTFVERKATFTLRGGQSITILNLPKDLQYEVTESDYSSERYRTTKSNDVGSIVADATQTVIFTNSRSTSGGGVTPPETPEEPETPETPEEPETPVTPEEPEGEVIIGEVDVPEGSLVTIVEGPEKGDFEIDEEGDWTYKPDPQKPDGNKVTIIVRDPDGNEEIIIIDLDDPIIPEGILELPKTGGMPLSIYLAIGGILVVLGLVFKRRKA